MSNKNMKGLTFYLPETARLARIAKESMTSEQQNGVDLFLINYADAIGIDSTSVKVFDKEKFLRLAGVSSKLSE